MSHDFGAVTIFTPRIRVRIGKIIGLDLLLRIEVTIINRIRIGVNVRILVRIVLQKV